MFKQEKGVTLVALVITIIVLLILAGVSIAMLTGDNGILTKSSNAKDETIKAEIKEQVMMGINEILVNKADTTNVATNTSSITTLTAANIAKVVNYNNSGISTSTDLSSATKPITAATEKIDSSSDATLTYVYGTKSYTVTLATTSKTVGSNTVYTITGVTSVVPIN